MSDTNTATNGPDAIRSYFREFGVLRQTRPEYWYVQIISLLDHTAYYAMLNIGTIFLSRDFHFTDGEAANAFTLFTFIVTGGLLMMGSLSDWLGVRRSLIYSMAGILLMRLGVAICALTDIVPLAYRGTLVVVLLGGMAPFVALWLTTLNAANKHFTTERSRGAGFNLSYLAMNFGGIIAGLLTQAVITWLGLPIGWIIAFGVLTALISVLISLLVVRRDAELFGDQADQPPKRHPLANSWLVMQQGVFWKFMLLVLLFIGVRLVFVWGSFITPKFAERVIGGLDQLGYLFMINPVIIVVGLVVLIPVLQRFNVFNMLVYGAIFSSLPLFLMAIPAHGDAALWLLVIYTSIFSIGELIWAPRLTEYTVAIAPHGQEATYVGLASFPMFLSKTLGSWLSGPMLVRWIPEKGPHGEPLIDWLKTGEVAYWNSPAALWFIIGIGAIFGPLVALALRSWYTKSMHESQKAVTH